MEDIVYQTTRKKEMTLRLIVLALLHVSALAVLMIWFDDNIYLLVKIFLALSTIARLVILWNTVNPMTLYTDRCMFSTFINSSVQRKYITGLGKHKKTGHLCLEYDDPERGHKGQLRLPWKFIAEPADEVLSHLIKWLDLDPNNLVINTAEE